MTTPPVTPKSPPRPGAETTAETTETTPETEVVDEAAKGTRGRYLIENVAGCPNCHTARVEGGAFDATKSSRASTASST